MAADDLERISDALDGTYPRLDIDVYDAATLAIRREFDEVEAITADIDSESTLNDHKDALRKLAARADIPEATLQTAIRTVETRIEHLGEETEEAEAPTFVKAKADEVDTFGDDDMNNLFASLFDIGSEEEADATQYG